MRILHAPKNVAGQASIISRAQRKLGHTSDVLVFNQNRFNFECDMNIDLDGHPSPIRPLVKLKYFLKVMRKYDVFHFHYGTSLLPRNLDLYLFAIIGRRVGKRTIMHYWGSDVIQIDLAKKYTLIPEAKLHEIFNIKDDQKRRNRIERTNSLVDLSVVGDYSLLPYSPNSQVVRQAIDYRAIPFIGAGNDDGLIRIVHAPTNRDIKGTSHVIKAVEKLRSEGMPLELVLVENRSHAEAMEIYKTAEMVVDDILQGPYGIFAMECMALGKPVLGRIDPSFSSYYTGLPIVNTTPETLLNNIKQLALNTEKRKDLGVEGRRYIEKNHDSDAIAAQLVSLYEALFKTIQ
jgi:glycosyltransferase involved in cell wall biosynthesis